MAQKWTTLNIPIINQYHKTKFSFTMTKEAPVVVVLSKVSPSLNPTDTALNYHKLDARYFRGFEGRYQFSLGFCIRKSGSGQPIVRTYQARGIKRSVRAELTLEAGRYEVSMRIEGMRFKSRPTIEELLQRPRNIHGFRQKLLRIARSYEIAHARGHDEDEGEERKAYRKRMAAEKARDLKKYKRALMKMKRQMKHSQNRKKRKARAAREKEKRKARKRSNNTAQKRRPKAGEIDEEEDSDAGARTGPRMTRSQAKGKKKAKGPRAVRPEDEDEPGNANAAPPSSEPDDDESELNSEVSDLSDNEVEELFMKMIEKKMRLQAPKADTPAQAKQKEKEKRAAEEANEFELDPWNASVVVGLRVYSKLSDVTLEVIRPEYEVSDSEEEEEEDEGGDSLVVAAGNVPRPEVVESVDDEGTDQQDSEMEWLPEDISPYTEKFFVTPR